MAVGFQIEVTQERYQTEVG